MNSDKWDSMDCRVPSVSCLIASLAAMQNLKHMYLLMGMTEEKYEEMIKRRKQEIFDAERNPNYQPWP